MVFASYQEKLQGFQVGFNQQKEACNPKKKFGFKNRAANAKKKVEEKKEVAKEVEAKEDPNTFYLKNIHKENLEDLPIDQNVLASKENIVIEDVSNCKITLSRTMKSGYIKKAKNCIIQIDVVQGSCFFFECDGCKFYMASQQIRIHHTTNTEFWLQVRSDPIIEHSNTLKFGDINKTDKLNEEILKRMQESDLTEINLWNNVKDFNWLKQDHSPNWEEIN